MNAGDGRRPGQVSISIVSHGQARLVERLLGDLARLDIRTIEVLLTINVPESPGFEAAACPFSVRIIENPAPKGFAANHNAAFAHASGEFFCVLNPDIRFTTDPFPTLLPELADRSVGVVAPLVLGASGTVEDSARPFPRPGDILLKALGFAPRQYYDIGASTLSPDWVGGMFMLFRAATFAEMGGFDPAYRLYYEDVDLCARLRGTGYDVRLSPRVSVIHLAQRRSRRNLKYALWHLRSMLRFFASHPSRRIRSDPRGAGIKP